MNARPKQCPDGRLYSEFLAPTVGPDPHPILDMDKAVPEFAFVFTRVGNVLLIVAMLAATGTHWAALQTVAWTGMIADNLRCGSLVGAVERTFDGKHPCCLCRQIEAGRKSEKKSEFPLALKRLEFMSSTPRFIFAAPTRVWRLSTPEASFESILHPPPTPPPRDCPA